MNGERVPNIVWARSDAPSRWLEMGAPKQNGDDVGSGFPAEGLAIEPDEERVARAGDHRVCPARYEIPGQLPSERRVERHLPGAALAFRDPQGTTSDIEVTQLEPDGLAEANA